MRLSEITVEEVAEYLREDPGAAMLAPVLAAARCYVLNYTGLTAQQADEHEDLSIAALAISADLYDHRGTVTTGISVSENPLVAQILGAHSVNLL